MPTNEEQPTRLDVQVIDRPVHSMHINDTAHKPMVTVDLDTGRVTLHEGFTFDEAAERFWQSIQVNGQSLYDRAEKAEAELRALKEANAND